MKGKHVYLGSEHKANPFLLLMFVQMTVLSWKKYFFYIKKIRMAINYDDAKRRAESQGRLFMREMFVYADSSNDPSEAGNVYDEVDELAEDMKIKPYFL